MSITLRGIVFLGISSGLLITGFALVDGILMTLGLAGLLTALFAVPIGRWNLAGLTLRLTAPHRIFAGIPFDLRLTVTNQKILVGTIDLNLELLLSGTVSLKNHTKWIVGSSKTKGKLRGSLPKRGTISSHPCRIRSTFPLGLFLFQKETSIHHEMLAFPQPRIPGELFQQGEFDDDWTGWGSRASDAPGEPRGLRPYQPGDRAKQIHWPATLRALARGRHPRVREYDPPGFRPAQVAVVFHSFGTDHTLIRTDLFERALSLTCGTLRHLRRLDVPATLYADFLSWQPQPTLQKEAWSTTLTHLAEAHRADHTEAHDLVRIVESISPATTVLVISDMPLKVWKHLIPSRPAKLIDIHQHRAAKKSLKFSTQQGLIAK